MTRLFSLLNKKVFLSDSVVVNIRKRRNDRRINAKLTKVNRRLEAEFLSDVDISELASRYTDDSGLDNIDLSSIKPKNYGKHFSVVHIPLKGGANVIGVNFSKSCS